MPDEKSECRECFVTGDTNIVQSNFLIERKQKLSLPATQLLFTLTGMINKDDEDLMEYKINVSYFADLWGIDLKLAYQTVADALTELREKGINEHTVNPKTGKKVFTTVGFISFGRYEHGEGYATVRIEPELKPHYIALKNKFTMYSLGNILQLQENGGQVNAMRTYELLKQYQSMGKRTLSVTEYKEQLGLITYDKKGNVIKEKYKGSNANLKKYVLDLAIEKINSSTDIETTYEIVGRGNKAKIVFTIRENKKEDTISTTTSDGETDEVNEMPTNLDDGFQEQINTSDHEEAPRELSIAERNRLALIQIARDVMRGTYEYTDAELELVVVAIENSLWWKAQQEQIQNEYLAGSAQVNAREILFRSHLEFQYKYCQIYSKSKTQKGFLSFLTKVLSAIQAQPEEETQEQEHSFDTDEFFELAVKRGPNVV